MIQKIALIVEAIFLIVSAVLLIVGIIAPILILIFSYLFNLGYRLITKSKEVIMGHYGAPFVLMVAMMLILSLLALSLLIDITITNYYYPELYNNLFHG